MADERVKLPGQICRAVLHFQEAMGWPDYVPRFAELYRPGKSSLFQLHEALTVADCEQVCEGHIRRARTAIERWKKTRSQTTLRTAARHIVFARLYRCEYIGKSGQERTAAEEDLPFPNMTDATEATA